MANIRKTFNFREGVKVDDSVLVVAGTRVGIGSTIPTKTLDVKGGATFSGQIVSSKLVVSGVSTFNDDIEGDNATNILGINSVTATKFYGDASGLDNLPTSQWTDMDVGLGFTSIYNSGNVGVGTTDPRFTMQIGSDPRTVGKEGVGIDGVSGNIQSSGIITATSFDGSLTGAGAVANASQTNIKTLGTLTGLDVNGHSELDNLNVSGVSTFTGSDVKFANQSIDNAVNWSKVADILQVRDDTKLTFGNSNDLKIYHTTASGGYSVIVDEGTGQLIIGGNIIEVKNASLNETYATFTGGKGVDLNYSNTKRFSTSGVGVTVYNQLDTTNLNVSGVGSFGSIGIGTTQPVSDIQILKSGNSAITLGRGSSATGNNGVISFGKETVGFPYSNANSLDIINYGIGNVNFYLEAGSVGVTTGDFFWHRRGNYGRLMTLTNGGRLGIGVTQPTNDLHVVGTSTITSNAFVGNDFSVKGDVNVVGGLTVGSFSVSTLSANVTGNLTGNVNAASGLSTFTKAKITSSLGINTVAPSTGIALNYGVNNVFVSGGGYIGIKTTSDAFLGINALNTPVIVGSVGAGTTLLKSSIDFSDAGKVGVVTTNRFMIPPKLTSVERSAIAAVQEGAFVYNTNNNRLEVYNGSSWVGVSSDVSSAGISNIVEDTSPELGGNLNGNSKSIYGVGILTATTFSGSGTSLTNIPGSQISGTIAAVSGINLTNLNASNLASGTLPAARITSLAASKLSGTIADARFPAILPASSGVKLTGIVTSIVAGANITLTGGPTGIVTIASSGGGSAGIGVSHDGSTVGVATVVNFSTNLDVTAVSSGIVTVTASGGGGSNLGITTNLSGSFTASAGVATTINSYAYGSELMFEYTVFVKNGSNYQSQKLLVMRDGTTPTSTQYGIMYNSNLLVQLDATISGGNVNLRATPETGITGSTTYRLRREAT